MKKLEVNIATAVSQFEKAIKEFRVRKVIYQTVFRGKGLEFEGYRNFEHDDDASMIDWKASRRSGRLLAKQYIEERNLEIYFLVDVSNSMLFGSRNKLKAEYAAEVVLALGRLILNSSDKIGLILFTDRVVKVLPPSKSKNQFYLFYKYLSDPAMYGGNLNYKEGMEFALKSIGNRSSVLIFISDFLHLKNEAESQLRLIGTKFESFALMVRDPLDETMPKIKGQIIVQDPYSGQQMVVDPSLAAVQYNRNALEQKNFVKTMFKNSNVDLLELNTNESFVLPLVSFLKSRAGTV